MIGLDTLPANPSFVLAANHYQRKGLWILHPCSVVTVRFNATTAWKILRSAGL